MKLHSGAYDSYKNAEGEWSATIPSEWQEKRVKDLFRLVTDAAPADNDYELLSLYAGIGVKPRKDLEARGNKASSTDGYWIVKKNDIVVNKLLAWMGSVGLSAYDGVTSPAYDVLRQVKPDIDPRYFAYLFRTEIAKKIFRKNSRGIMDMRLRLYFDKLGAITVPVPSYQVQRRVADYIDEKTYKIDRKIEILSQKYSQLNKLKTSIINQYVIKGLSNDVLTQDSKVSWLGSIPQGWSIKRHKDYFDLVNIRCCEKNLPKIGLENIESKTGRFVETTSEFDGDGIRFRVNDILFGKLRPYLAKVYLADFEGNAVGDIFVYRPKNGVLPKFAKYLMLSSTYIDVINSSTAGAKMPRVSSSFIANLPVAIPSEDDQKEVITKIDSSIQHIEEKQTLIEKHIAKLRQLRIALINDAVTGRLKISESNVNRELVA